MAILTEGKHTAEFVLSEAAGHLSRENITVLSGEGKLGAGAVLGKTVTGSSAAVSAKAGNTGNGAFTIDPTTPVLGNAKPGRYVVACIEPTTNLGTFQVTDPDGVILGSYVVAAAAFANQIKFTIADGGTDFAAGDAFFVDVAVTAVKYRSADPTNTDGSGTASAVLYGAVDATSADAAGVIIARHAEVNRNLLTYDSNVDDVAKLAAKIVELAAAAIIVR